MEEIIDQPYVDGEGHYTTIGMGSGAHIDVKPEETMPLFGNLMKYRNEDYGVVTEAPSTLFSMIPVTTIHNVRPQLGHGAPTIECTPQVYDYKTSYISSLPGNGFPNVTPQLGHGAKTVYGSGGVPKVRRTRRLKRN